jgi:hypothetical protein
MTKRAAYLASIALLATTAVPASAAQIVADFTINVSGTGDDDYVSTPFDLFNPSLGQLTLVTESITGPLTWSTNNPGEQLQLIAMLTSAGQLVSASVTGSATHVKVSLNGVSNNASLFQRLGTAQETLFARGSDDNLSGDPLFGQFTYFYTPAVPPTPPPTGAVPEPSTWAMMLIGFAGLSYAVRRRGAVRAISASPGTSRPTLP